MTFVHCEYMFSLLDFCTHYKNSRHKFLRKVCKETCVPPPPKFHDDVTPIFMENFNTKVNLMCDEWTDDHTNERKIHVSMCSKTGISFLCEVQKTHPTIWHTYINNNKVCGQISDSCD